MPGRIPLVVIIGERIGDLRRRKGLTQDKLAERVADAGWTGATISRYETGEREMGITSFIAIADALNTSLDELAGRKRYNAAPEGFNELSEANREIVRDLIQVMLRRQEIRFA